MLDRSVGRRECFTNGGGRVSAIDASEASVSDSPAYRLELTYSIRSLKNTENIDIY